MYIFLDLGLLENHRLGVTTQLVTTTVQSELTATDIEAHWIMKR